MPRARLKIKPTHNRLASFSEHYPDDEFRMLTVYPTENGLFVLIDARTDAVDELVAHLEAASAALEYDVLHTDEHGVVVQLLIPEPDPHQAALASKNMPSSPLVVRDGWIFTEMVTSRDRLSKFETEMENAGVTFELLSVEESRSPRELLTERQHEFVREAFDQGYYESPRQCSLTEFSESVGVDKSTASGVLHRAEGRIIAAFLTSPEREGSGK